MVAWYYFPGLFYILYIYVLVASQRSFNFFSIFAYLQVLVYILEQCNSTCIDRGVSSS